MSAVTAADRELLREQLRRLLTAPGGDDRWPALVDLGLAELGAAEAAGGWPEWAMALQELGRAACPAPLLASAIVQRVLDGSAHSVLHGPAAARPAVAFGPHDGDPAAGHVEWRDGRLHGRLRFVEGGLEADHLLVFLDGPPGAAWMSLDQSGIERRAAHGLAVPALAELDLRAVPAEAVDVDAALIDELRLLTRLGLLSRALGAARRMAELAIDYAGIRRQFGRPIGAFQAIQHKLADVAMALDATEGLLSMAFEAHAAGRPWRPVAWAAVAHGGTALRQVAMETHQALGAIGYDEAHELPRHFRRIHADTTRHGGAREAAAALGRYLLVDGGRLPDTPLSDAGEAFRREVREWLAVHWDAARRAEHDARPYDERARHAEFERALGGQGWLGIAWPRAHGGQNRTPHEQLAYIQELERVDAPGLRMSLQAPALIKFGTPAQQQRYLPPLLRGEIRICLGYSEPEAGSDLAAMRTRAVRDGEDWVIDGQKLWSTHATYSDYVWLAARTDPHAQPANAGISMFIVPLKNIAGVTVRPSMAMYGRPFCTLEFEGVRVPADALVGPVNDGWKILTAALAEERMQMGSVVYRCRRVFEGLCDALAADPVARGDGAVRERIGQLAAQVEVARALLDRIIDDVNPATVPPHAAAMSKVCSSELMRTLGETALDLLGLRATLGQHAPGSLLNGELEQLLRHSLMYTIGGGTQEIQRTLIATRGLGLPRG